MRRLRVEARAVRLLLLRLLLRRLDWWLLLRLAAVRGLARRVRSDAGRVLVLLVARALLRRQGPVQAEGGLRVHLRPRDCWGQ